MIRSPLYLAPLLAFAFAATAEALPSLTPASLYLRARAAESSGRPDDASVQFRVLLAQSNLDPVVVERAYRVAISVGDMPLALQAARTFAARGAAVADARVLLTLDPIKRRDWEGARAAVSQLGQDRAFAFLAPYLRAWIAFGSGEGDALSIINEARSVPQASPYLPEQRALLLIALGRSQDAIGSLGPQAAAKLPERVPDAGQGIAPLLLNVTADLARQSLLPVGIFMARLATFAAPDDARSWFLLADGLQRMRQADLALAALDHIPDTDPLAPAVRAARLALLNQAGKRDEALAGALALARRPDAAAIDWARVGELYGLLQRPREAANAFARALTLAKAANASADAIWPILLQQGAALDLAGDWTAAKAALLQAFALAPHEPVVLNQVGYAFVERREELKRAAEMIAEASRLKPNDAAITDSFGWVLYLQGRAAEAVPLLERASAGAPGEAAINEHLGDAYWAVGRQYEARYAWRAALLTAEEKDHVRLNGKVDFGPSAGAASP